VMLKWCNVLISITHLEMNQKVSWIDE
jgi:hypothetical protein